MSGWDRNLLSSSPLPSFFPTRRSSINPKLPSLQLLSHIPLLPTSHTRNDLTTPRHRATMKTLITTFTLPLSPAPSVTRNHTPTPRSPPENLALVARNQVLNYGTSDAIYKTHFGNGPTAGFIGWFSKLLAGDKTVLSFVAAILTGTGWAGHWRCENATEETVICELLYQVDVHWSKYVC